jgi:hypothetical protein
VGPPGLQGDQGPQGVQGNQGFGGFRGFEGPAGPQGVQGFQGNRGFQGFKGHRGLDTGRGPDGFEGATGPQGSRGPQGFQGNPGYDFFEGPQGPEGLIGIEGVEGPQGFRGPSSVFTYSTVEAYLSFITTPGIYTIPSYFFPSDSYPVFVNGFYYTYDFTTPDSDFDLIGVRVIQVGSDSYISATINVKTVSPEFGYLDTIYVFYVYYN